MNDSIPRLLAESLVQTVGEHGVILVGSAPQLFPSELLTPEIELLGGMEMRNHSVTVLQVRATEPEAARNMILAEMKRAGFDAPPDIRQKGFVMDGMPEFRQHTKGDIGVMLRFMSRQPHGTLVHVMVGPRIDRDERPRGRMMREYLEESSPMPQLRAPIDRQVTDSGGGSSGDFSHIRCSVSPQIQPEMAFAHYHAQIVNQGWITVGTHSDNRSASASYVFDDEKGFRWSGMLAIAPREDAGSTVINFALASLSGRSEHRGSSIAMGMPRAQ